MAIYEFEEYEKFQNLLSELDEMNIDTSIIRNYVYHIEQENRKLSYDNDVLKDNVLISNYMNENN